ncbi:hypothetical protein FLQ13_12860 [Bacillus halotolerans]|nr:hypothetical protein CJU60_10685 [Bacillus sp. 7705b]QDK68284.1 hypothetical protein FLQ13_12860 [Bacillus halotolerans]
MRAFGGPISCPIVFLFEYHVNSNYSDMSTLFYSTFFGLMFITYFSYSQIALISMNPRSSLLNCSAKGFLLFSIVFIVL